MATYADGHQTILTCSDWMGSGSLFSRQDFANDMPMMYSTHGKLIPDIEIIRYESMINPFAEYWRSRKHGKPLEDWEGRN